MDGSNPEGQGTFLDEVLGAPGAVVLDFGAAWCGPCRRLEPELETLHQEWGERVSLYQVNTDMEPGLAARFQVMSLPTLILFVDGQEKARLMGYMPARRISDAFAPHLPPAP